MRNDDRRALEQFKLRSKFDHDGLAWKILEFLSAKAAAKRDDQLNVQICATFSDDPEGFFRAVLQSSHRRINERTAVEPFPWKIDLRPLLIEKEKSGVMESRWLWAAIELKRVRHLRNLQEWRERLVSALMPLQAPCLALAIDDPEDRAGHLGKDEDSKLIADSPGQVKAGRPVEEERRHAVVIDEGRQNRHRCEWQAKILRNITPEVGLVDDHRIQLSFPYGLRRVTKEHDRGVLYALYDEPEDRQAMKFAESLIEFAQGSERIVLLTDDAEFEARCADARFDVRNTEEDYFVTAFLKCESERSERVKVASAGEADNADSCHCGA